MSFYRKKEPLMFDIDYKLNCNILNRVQIVKDLGVIFYTKLTSNDHVDYITAKA